MSAVIKLDAEIRQLGGTGAARALRLKNRVPAIVYGENKPGVNVSIAKKELTLAYHKGGFTSRIVELKTGNETLRVIPRDVQLDPVTDEVLHADFQRVSKGAKIRVMVKVIFDNADKSPGIKRGGILNIVRHSIEMLCPADAIPESIHSDLTGLTIGKSVHIKDVKLPEGCTPTIKRNFTIATIAGRSEEKDDTAAPVMAAGDVPVIGKEAEPAEGEAATAAKAGDKKAAAPAAEKKPAEKKK